MRNLYQVLQVSRDASASQIKQAYRQLALIYHPDRQTAAANADKFREIQEAYEILSDVEARALYDENWLKHSQAKEKIKKDAEERKAQQERQQQAHQTQNTQTNRAQPFYQEILSALQTVHNKMQTITNARGNIDQARVFKVLRQILSTDNIDTLLRTANAVANAAIIRQTMATVTMLSFPYIENICAQLVRLAGSDKTLLSEIHVFVQSRKKKAVDRRKAVVTLLVIAAIFTVVTLANMADSSSRSYGNYTPKHGSTSSSYTPPTSSSDYTYTTPSATVDQSTPAPSLFNDEGSEPPATSEQTDVNDTGGNADDLFTQPRLVEDPEEGWETMEYASGDRPGCFDFTSARDADMPNELAITVGGNADVVVKLIEYGTDNCIRYVYVTRYSTYHMRNVPEGRYYLKIAYGKSWKEKKIDGKCHGKFSVGALYEKGEDILDFNKKYTGDGYQIPSYSIKLDVIASPLSDNLETNNISESEFNN